MLDLKAMPTMRANLLEFIKADPIFLVLSRPTLTKTTAGGWVKGVPRSLPRQMFRVTPFKRRLSNMQVTNQAGSIPNLDYVLVGKHTADIRRDDEFDYNGDHYRVVSVEPKTDDRTRTDRVVAQLEVLGGDKAPPT